MPNLLRLSLAILVWLSLTQCKSRRAAQDPNAGFERVTTTQQFLQALRPGAKILLAPGDYLLTEMASMTTAYLSWEDPYDGAEAHLANLDNVVIRGEEGVRLLATPRYAWVLQFEQCSNLTFENVTFGHTEAGYCLGGVLAFKGGSGIRLRDCNLYGSGTEGLLIEGVEEFSMKNSRVYECTYDLMTVRSSRSLRFEDCAFTKTGEFNLITLSGSGDIAFEGCSFRNNFNDTFMPYFFYTENSQGGITIRNCTFVDNHVQKFSNQPSDLTLDDNEFKGNDFD